MSISSSSTSSYAAMSNSLHLTANSVPGYGPVDGSCLSLSGFSQRPAAVCVSPCSSHWGIFSHIKIRSAGTPSFICMANSGGHRTNPDFSRQGKQGFSRGNNRYSQNEDRNMDDDDDDEDELLMPLKNGVYFNQKSQSTAAPGEREKEIIELFKKVQVLLREKAGVKTEKKVEPSSPQGKVPKETETVGSLLNLLRKHSNVSKEDSSSDHRKNSSFSKEDSSGDQLEQTWGNNEDYKSSSSGGVHSVNKYSNGAVDSTAASFARPPSSFRKRTPFMRTTMPPPPPPRVDSSNGEDYVTSKTRSNSSGGKKEEYEVIPDAIHEPGDEHGSEMLLAELDDDSGEDEEHDADDDVEDLSSMKITELKQLAKARGIKRYSKMNKSELVEVLSGGSSD